MNVSILSFTRKGALLSIELKNKLEKQNEQQIEKQLKQSKDWPDRVCCFTTEQWAVLDEEMEAIAPDLNTLTGRLFRKDSALIFIGACGIAVRAIAPFVKDKKFDPAVLCIDERCRYVIPVLSGHIGGANRLANEVAGMIGAESVITTATDINRVFSVDEWATANDAYLSDMAAAKKIASLLLEHQPVGFVSEFEMDGQMPKGVTDVTAVREPSHDLETGICVSIKEKKAPFPTTLQVIPRNIYLGFGCRKGISSKAIEEFLLDLLEKENISIHSVKGIASIDLKKEEKGLLDFALKYLLPVKFFHAKELQSVEGEFTASEFVRTVAGVENVCERSAVLASKNGTLLCRKVSKNGMTAALAQRNWRGRFEY